MKKKIDIFIITAFVFISFLVSFSDRNEIFPFFQWNLYSWTAPVIKVRTFLITNPDCQLDKVPLSSFLRKEIQNEEDYALFHWDYYWNKKINEQPIRLLISKYFCQKGITKITPALIEARPHNLWNSDEFSLLETLGNDIEINHSKT